MRIFILALFLQISTSFAQTTKSIDYYYYKLNDNTFLCDADANAASKENRKKSISVIDIKNGYIKAKLAVGELQVALFKDRAAKKDLIIATVNCGSGCMCNTIQFYVADALGNVKETESIFPIQEIESENNKWKTYYKTDELFTAYVLPQIGTSIKVINSDTGDFLYSLKWVENKFILQKK